MRRIHSSNDAENIDKSKKAIKLNWFQKQNKMPSGNSVNLVDLPRYEATKLPTTSPVYLTMR